MSTRRLTLRAGSWPTLLFPFASEVVQAEERVPLAPLCVYALHDYHERAIAGHFPPLVVRGWARGVQPFAFV